MHKYRIIVVDDEQIVALDISRTLQRLGYDVVAMEADAEGAIAAAQRLRPDLVLMDIRLRKGNGIDAAKSITDQTGTPVIFLTAFSDQQTLDRAKQAGPFGFLIKPFEERELHSTIEVVLLKHRAVRELDLAKRAAEHESLAKSTFLANMSHEIRNSLNGIVGMADIVLDTPLSSEQRECVTTVLDSAETLLALLNDILDFSRIEARQLRLVERPFTLSQLLNRVVRAASAEASRKGLELFWRAAPEVPDTLRGDPTRITQILANLIGNAVKFTHEGFVAIEVSLVPSEPTLMESLFPKGGQGTLTLLFSVRDSGIGIPEDRLSNIFEMFSQGCDDTATTFGGSGLGLSICRQLTDMMGGSIWASSEPGKGSTFSFTCRLGNQQTSPQAPHQPCLPAPAPMGHHRKLHVLVVDDNLVARTIASKLLRKRGHTCHTVADGTEALFMLTKERFDLMLLDIRLPGICGLELLQRVRHTQHPAVTPTMPIVAVTGHALQGDRERFLAAGMTDYIPKPISAGAFHAVIDRIAASLGPMPAGNGATTIAPDTPRQTPPPLIDEQGLLIRLEGDERLLRMVWQAYVEEAPRMFAQLLAPCTLHDFIASSSRAEALQSVSANAGAEAVANAAASLNAVLEVRDVESISVQLSEVDTLLGKTLTAMRARLALRE